MQVSPAQKISRHVYTLRQQPTELCVHNFWAPLYSPLSPPPLCISEQPVGKKKRDYVCSDKKTPERERKSSKSKCRFPLFPSQLFFKIITQQDSLQELHDHILENKIGFGTFQQGLQPKLFSLSVEKPIQTLIPLFFFFKFPYSQPVHPLSELGLSQAIQCACFKCFKLHKLCHSVQNKCTKRSVEPFKNYIHTLSSLSVRTERSGFFSSLPDLCKQAPQTDSWHVSTST